MVGFLRASALIAAAAAFNVQYAPKGDESSNDRRKRWEENARAAGGASCIQKPGGFKCENLRATSEALCVAGEHKDSCQWSDGHKTRAQLWRELVEPPAPKVDEPGKPELYEPPPAGLDLNPEGMPLGQGEGVGHESPNQLPSDEAITAEHMGMGVCCPNPRDDCICDDAALKEMCFHSLKVYEYKTKAHEVYTSLGHCWFALADCEGCIMAPKSHPNELRMMQSCPKNECPKEQETNPDGSPVPEKPCEATCRTNLGHGQLACGPDACGNVDACGTCEALGNCKNKGNRVCPDYLQRETKEDCDGANGHENCEWQSVAECVGPAGDGICVARPYSRRFVPLDINKAPKWFARQHGTYNKPTR